MKPHISIVIPVYNNESSIEPLYDRVTKTLNESGHNNHEVIFVNDGSKDGSWKVLTHLAKINPIRCKAINLSRNFGQHKAVTAGLSKTSGDYVAIMDCDLQDPPENLKALLTAIATNDIDIVYTKRERRQHSLWKRTLTKIYQIGFRLVSNKDYNIEYGSMVLFTRRVRDAFLQISEHYRLYLQILLWLGFSSKVITVTHHKRQHGQSSYTLSKLIDLGIDALLFNSDRPIRLVTTLGITMSIISITGATLLLFARLSDSTYQIGWPSIILTTLFSSGLILFSLGIIGLYIGRLYTEVKRRPLYIIDEEINFE